MRKETLPQWMVKEDFEEFMKTNYDQEKIQQLWEGIQWRIYLPSSLEKE